MKRPGLIVDGVSVPESRRRPLPTAVPKPCCARFMWGDETHDPNCPKKPRVFDHLDGSPDDAFLSKVAREMRASAWWSTVSQWEHPKPVTGEIDPEGFGWDPA